MPIDKAGIARLIPHAGAMCLLDSVLAWDASSIRCSATGHRDADNPLRTGDRLPVLCGIEYAAQAMAVHGGLSGAAGERPRAGYLASVRNVVCTVDRLDTLEGKLIITAESLMGDDSRVVYRFDVEHDGRSVLSGRAAVVLDVGLL
jgi:predicted hotdog family 3-hydroxylacyl-ACP dehydratase